MKEEEEKRKRKGTEKAKMEKDSGHFGHLRQGVEIDSQARPKEEEKQKWGEHKPHKAGGNNGWRT